MNLNVEISDEALALLRPAASATTDTSAILAHIDQRFDEVLAEIHKSASPLCDREGAAAYLSCSKGFIDQLANQGKLKRQWLTDSMPRFRKSDLDALLEKETKMHERKQFQKAA